MLQIILLVLLPLVMQIHAGQDHYFQYANVPSPHAYEFGYNRGNPHHFTSRFEKAHGWTFKTKVRWGDKHGWGESYWDYNHGDNTKKGHKGHSHGHHGHKGWQQPSHSNNVEHVVDGGDVKNGEVVARSYDRPVYYWDRESY